jgi:hypothetical protein
MSSHLRRAIILVWSRIPVAFRWSVHNRRPVYLPETNWGSLETLDIPYVPRIYRTWRIWVCFGLINMVPCFKMTPGLLTAHHWVQWTIVELLWPRRTVEMAFTTPATRTVRAPATRKVRAPVKHLALWDCHTSDAFVIVDGHVTLVDCWTPPNVGKCRCQSERCVCWRFGRVGVESPDSETAHGYNLKPWYYRLYPTLK